MEQKALVHRVLRIAIGLALCSASSAPATTSPARPATDGLPVGRSVKMGNHLGKGTPILDFGNGFSKIGLRVQRNAAPYPGFGEQAQSIGPNWKLYQIKTQAKIGIPKGQGVVGLHLAGAKQVVEVGRGYVLNGVTP